MPPHLILAIESSNPSSGPNDPANTPPLGPGVALGELKDPATPALLGAEPFREGGRHADDLAAAIDRLTRKLGFTPANIARVAVSIGPGGYTGLRIAIATAKMIAEARGAQAVPVPSALVAAHLVWTIKPQQTPGPALVCLASKADSAHATLLLRPEDRPWWESSGRAEVHRIAQTPPPGPAAEFPAALAPLALGLIRGPQVRALAPGAIIADRFCPEGIRAAAEDLGILIIEPAFSPVTVLELGARSAPVDPLKLSPLYPREPDAVTQWRARHG